MNLLTTIKTMFTILALSAMIGLQAQNFSEIGNAMKSGNAASLAKHFDSNVEVTILNTEAAYSKSQAEMVIKNFFSGNTPSQYKVVHNGDSGSGATYQIGELSTSNGTYRTYIYAKAKSGTMIIQEIRFEKN